MGGGGGDAASSPPLGSLRALDGYDGGEPSRRHPAVGERPR